MSFSVSYSNGAEQRPYEDWVKNQRKCNHAGFRYIYQCGYNIHDFVFVPASNRLYVYIDAGYSNVLSTMFVSVDAVAKRIYVQAATSTAENYWPQENGAGCMHGEGGPVFTDQALAYYKDNNVVDAFDAVTNMFFGKDWEFAPLPKCDELRVPSEMLDHVDMDKWFGYADYTYPRPTGTVAYYNPEPDEAATRIQSAFRGWIERIKYRYSPHNRLGRHLILCEAGFAVEKE